MFMSKLMKVVSALMAVMISALFLTGCQRESEENGPIVLTYGAHIANMAQQEPATYVVFRAFMDDNPDIVIDIQGAGTDEHVMRMRMASQAGTLPDMFWLLPAPSLEMWEAGLLLDFSEYFALSPDVDARIGDIVRSMSPVDDAAFGLPYQKLVTGMWYNRALFREFNVPTPVNGTTIDEFLEMVDVFYANDVVTVAKGARDPFSVWNFLLGWARFGFFDKIDAIQAGDESFVNYAFIRYFEHIDEMRMRGAFPSNIATLDYFQAANMFMNGESAMMDSGVWDTARFSEALGEDLGFWWGPVFPDGVGNQNISMQAPTNNVRVNIVSWQDERRRDAIRRFLDFFYSAEADQLRIEHGSVPLANPGDTSEVEPGFRAVLEAMAGDWPSVPDQADLVVSQPVQVAMYNALYGVMIGTFTPEQALTNIEQAQDRER